MVTKQLIEKDLLVIKLHTTYLLKLLLSYLEILFFISRLAFFQKKSKHVTKKKTKYKIYFKPAKHKKINNVFMVKNFT